jgi:hypothetical protein
LPTLNRTQQQSSQEWLVAPSVRLPSANTGLVVHVLLLLAHLLRCTAEALWASIQLVG